MSTDETITLVLNKPLALWLHFRHVQQHVTGIRPCEHAPFNRPDDIHVQRPKVHPHWQDGRCVSTRLCKMFARIPLSHVRVVAEGRVLLLLSAHARMAIRSTVASTSTRPPIDGPRQIFRSFYWPTAPPHFTLLEQQIARLSIVQSFKSFNNETIKLYCLR